MTAQPSHRLWTRQFILVMLGLACISFANYACTAIIAFYVGKITGSLAYSGFVGGAFFVASLVLRPVSGIAVDRIGTRGILLASTLLCAGACAMHAVAGSVAVLVGCRILHGVGYSFYTTAGSTVAANIVPLARRSEGLGYYMLGNVIAMAIGPAIVLAVMGDQTMAEFHTCFLIAGAICLLAFVMVLYLGRTGGLSATQQEGGGAPRRDEPELPRTFLGFEAGVIWPCCMGFLMLASHSAIVLYLAPYGKDSGWGNVGPYFGLFAVTMMFPRALLGRLADRHGTDVVVFPCLLLAMGGYALVAFAGAPWMLYAAAIPLGIAMGMVMPQINGFCISRCSLERRGTAAAAFYLAVDGGIALGMVFFGRIVALFGYRPSYLVCAVAMVAALAVYVCTLRGPRAGPH